MSSCGCHGEALAFAVSDLDISALSTQLDSVQVSSRDVPVNIVAVTDLTSSVGLASTSAATGIMTLGRDGDIVSVSLPPATFTNDTVGPNGPIRVTYTPITPLTPAQWTQVYAPITDVWHSMPYQTTAGGGPPSTVPASIRINATNGVVTAWFGGAVTNGAQAWLPNLATGNQIPTYNRKM